NTLGGIVFQGGYATTHDILGTGIVNLGLVTVPGFNYLNIRNSVASLYKYYNYGYTNNYSVVNNIYEFYNYSNFYAYNNFSVINRFYNEYVFNVYNTYYANPSFYVGNYFVNNSQYFNPAVSNFYFTGANAQISGNYAPSFYNFYVNNNVNLNLNVGINVYASFANSGYFNGIGYPVSFLNNGYNIPILISGSGYSNFGSVIFNNIYGVNILNNIAVQNNFINIAGFTAGTSNISFTGNGLQNISSTGINSLTFNGINIAEATADLSVDANLIVQGSFANRGRFRNTRATYFESNVPQYITGFGISRFNNFYNYNTNLSGLTIITNIEVDGNIENNGVLNAVGYTVSTTGLTAQTISGTSVSTFGSIENSNIAGLEINQDIVVQGSFANRGRMRSRSNSVTFGGNEVQNVSSTSETTLNTIIVTNTVAAVNLDGAFLVTGNIESNGNFNASAASISTSGTSMQTISGTNDATFGEVTNTNAAGVVATQDVVVNGSFSNRGRFRSTKTLSLEGSATQDISGTVPLQLSNLNNDNTSLVNLVVPIEVDGNISNQGILNGSTSTISTTGTAMQTIAGDNITLGNIVNSNAMGVMLPDPIEIKGNLVNDGKLESTSMVSFSGVNQTISGTTAVLVDDVAITESANVAVAGSFRTRGRFVNNSASAGLVAAPTSIVTFEGGAQQSIEGTKATNFGQVSVTNPMGIEVVQSFSSTSLSLSGGNLSVDTLKSVSVTSPDPKAIVRTNDSYVDGTLSRAVTATGVSYEFPVGTENAFRGVEVTFAGVNNAGKIAVTPNPVEPKLTLPDPSGAPLAVFDPTLSDTLKAILPLSWKVEAQNATIAGTYDISFQAPVTLPGYTDPNALTVIKRADETSPWVLAGSPAPVTTTPTKAIRVGRRNVSSFSEFAVAGTCINLNKAISRPTIDEVAGNFKSNFAANKYVWSINDTIQKALTTRQITPTKSGKYRVKILISGCPSDESEFVQFTASITGTNGFNSNADFRLYPNPTKGEFTLESNSLLSGDYFVEMFDVIGKPVFAKTVNQVSGKVSKFTYNTAGLPTGIYFIKISNNGNGKVLKLIVE
ncbi:MAG: T9SS type A sorting domain-containing protein, partial [Cytophagales bacterium]